MRIAVGRADFDNIVADLENRDIECTAAEVEDHDLLFLFLIEPICKRCRGRFVDDALYVEPCNFAGVAGSCALRVVEVRRYGNDRFGDRFAQASLGVCLDLLKDHRGDLLRSVPCVTHLHFDAAVGCFSHFKRNC